MAADFKDFLSKREVLVFFDLEATQFSHDPLEIGLIAYKNDGGVLSEELFSYRAYIRSDEKIGSIVNRMTGIDEKLLEEKGRDRTSVLKEVIDLLRPLRRKGYISFGDQDLLILKHFITDEIFTLDFYTHVYHNHFDFQRYIYSLYEEKTNLSLHDLCSIFMVDNTHPHDALSDAITLKEVYSAVLADENRSVKLLEDFLSTKEKR